MKLAVTTAFLAALRLASPALADKQEEGNIAPQCTTMDADGTCLDASLVDQNDDDNEESTESSPYPPTCGLYMAESSIPNAGWGMYAARNIGQGEDIVPLDLVIQVYDAPRWVREGRRSWLLSEYVWNSGE